MTVKGEVAPVACDALTWVGPTPWPGRTDLLVCLACLGFASFASLLHKYSPGGSGPSAAPDQSLGTTHLAPMAELS